MLTSKQILTNMQNDKRLTDSRSRSKKKKNNYSNIYTQLLGELGYAGIKKNGYFTKFFSYGVAGHCASFVQYHLIKAGYQNCVPKKGYIWNTTYYAKWLKTEPNIKGLGKVDWTKDIKKAQAAAKAGKFVIVFQGAKGLSHTCALLKIENGYIWTVDGNVKGTYKGKKINNGVIKKRKASKGKWRFAIMPIPVTIAPPKPKPAPTPKPAPYSKGKTYTLLDNMNVRSGHSTKNKVVGHRKKGEKVTAYEVHKTGNGGYWIKVSKDKAHWICAKTNKKKYMK